MATHPHASRCMNTVEFPTSTGRHVPLGQLLGSEGLGSLRAFNRAKKIPDDEGSQARRLSDSVKESDQSQRADDTANIRYEFWG